MAENTETAENIENTDVDTGMMNITMIIQMLGLEDFLADVELTTIFGTLAALLLVGWLIKWLTTKNKAKTNSTTSDSTVPQEEMPWRRLDVAWGDQDYFNAKRDGIMEWKPPRGLQSANILLVGMHQSGKSSFVNTINHALIRTMEKPAIARPSARSVTLKYRAHTLEDSDGSTPAFKLCDLKGLAEECDFAEIAKKFEELLDGHVETGQMVDLSSQSTVSRPASNKVNEFREQIHAFVLVVDGSRLEVLSGDVRRSIDVLQRTAEKREMPFVVVMTKIDSIDPVLRNDVTRVHDSRPISKSVTRLGELLQSDKSFIMPVKNYTDEMRLDVKTDVLAMLAMNKILLATQAYIRKSVNNLSTKSEKDV